MVEVLKDCIRIFLFIINAVTVVVGLIISAVGIYCISKSQSDPLQDLDTGSLVGFVVCTLLIGLVIIVIGMLGCFGSLNQSPKTMNVYMGMIAFILLIETAALIAIFVNKTKIKEQAEEGFEKYVKEYNNDTTDDNIKAGVDAVQQTLQCCGYVGVGDYGVGPVPTSCCEVEVDLYTACPGKKRFTEGCKVDLAGFVDGVVVIFGVAMAFGMLLSIVSLCGAFYVKKHSPKYDHLA